jgi:hypothetical protein
MWKLDLPVKCIYKYICDKYINAYIDIYDHIYIHTYIYTEREQIVLVGLSEGTMGSGRGKENVRE